MNTISLTINDLEMGKDSPILWIGAVDGSEYRIGGAAFFAAGTQAGGGKDAAKSWTIDFSKFAGVVGDPLEPVGFITLREPEGHIYLKGTTYGDPVEVLVPEPSAGWLGAFGLILLLRRRRG